MKKNLNKNLILIGVVILIVLVIFFLQRDSNKELGVIFESNTGTNIGDKAPNFILEDLKGDRITLEQYRGKAVLINFWATWCSPCREEFPLLQEKFAENEDLIILGINLQETNLDLINNFKDEFQVTFPLLLDPDAEVKDEYGVFTQPVSFFIDKNRVIQGRKFGPFTIEELNTNIEKILNIEITEVKVEEKGEIKTLEDGTKYIIHPDDFQSGGPPKDGIPSIDDPQFITVNEVDFLEDDDLVLGLNYNGVVKAYPEQILVWHEIVNDFANDEAILITWCPLCGTGIAFERILNNGAVEFGVSGKLVNSDLIMFDRLTETYWTQVGGKAVLGELTGEKLKQIPIDTVRWKDWKREHPDSLVLSRDTGSFRNYGTSPYGDYDTNSRIIFPVDNEDDRLHPKAVIYGIEINGKYKAYPDDLIIDKIEDNFDGANLIIERKDDGGIKITNNGEELIFTRSFWFAWAAFFPDTELYS